MKAYLAYVRIQMHVSVCACVFACVSNMKAYLAYVRTQMHVSVCACVFACVSNMKAYLTCACFHRTHVYLSVCMYVCVSVSLELEGMLGTYMS
jgi:hypothetical protein